MASSKLLSLSNYADQFYQQEEAQLSKNYPGISPRRIKEEILNISASADLESIYFPSKSNPVTMLFAMLKEGVPLAHISGRGYFYRSEFSVGPDVLIPRSETEILVERAVSEVNKLSKRLAERVQIADLGTGSGAIILSILRDAIAPIDAYALDISEKALSVAKRNYFNLRYTINPQSTLEFSQGDRFDGFSNKLHVIVTNPPYIKRKSDRDGVHDLVDLHEPESALYLDDEIYDEWFDTLFKQSVDLLHSGGLFLMEGHERHLQVLKNRCEAVGFVDVKVITDYTSRERFIIATKK